MDPFFGLPEAVGTQLIGRTSDEPIVAQFERDPNPIIRAQQQVATLLQPVERPGARRATASPHADSDILVSLHVPALAENPSVDKVRASLRQWGYPALAKAVKQPALAWLSACYDGDWVAAEATEDGDDPRVDTLIGALVNLCYFEGSPLQATFADIAAWPLDAHLSNIARGLSARYTRHGAEILLSARFECRGPERDGALAWQCDHLARWIVQYEEQRPCKGCLMVGPHLNRHLPFFWQAIEEEVVQPLEEERGGTLDEEPAERIVRRGDAPHLAGLTLHTGDQANPVAIDGDYIVETAAMMGRRAAAHTGALSLRPYAPLDHIHGRISFIDLAEPDKAQLLWTAWEDLQTEKGDA